MTTVYVLNETGYEPSIQGIFTDKDVAQRLADRSGGELCVEVWELNDHPAFEKDGQYRFHVEYDAADADWSVRLMNKYDTIDWDRDSAQWKQSTWTDHTVPYAVQPYLPSMQDWLIYVVASDEKGALKLAYKLLQDKGFPCEEPQYPQGDADV